MKYLEKQKPYTLKEIIKLSYDSEEIEQSLENLWFFNSNEDNDDELNLDSIVYLDEPLNIPIEKDDIEHEDFFSDFVKKNNLWNCYYGDQFVDVLSHYKNNNNKLDSKLLLKGLNYYAEVDDFYDY